MSDQLGDLNLDVMMDVSRDLRRNVLHLDAMGDRNLSAVDANRGHHMSDLHLDVTNDLNLVVKTDASRDHHMNVTGDRNDLKTDASRDLRMSDLHLDVTGDRKMDAMMGVNHDHHKNVKLDDLNLSAVDANRGLHMNETDDRNDLKTDVSRDHRKSDLHLVVKILDVKMNCHRAIRKCAHPALNDLSLGAKKTGDLNMNCDQLSRDHLLCDHRKLRRRGKNLN
jgi:hypothetical protein